VTTFAWPVSWYPQNVEVASVPNVRVHTSPYSQDTQAIDLLGERWRIAFLLPERSEIHQSIGAAREAYFTRLRGRVHRVNLPHFKRPVPRGSMRGVPVLSASVAQGASALAITTTAGATLLAGDILGLGGEWLMVADDATASGGGALAVNLSNRVRVPRAGGFGVTWQTPVLQCMLTADIVPVAYRPGATDPLQLEFMEAW
jgi:hypothetical protein